MSTGIWAEQRVRELDGKFPQITGTGKQTKSWSSTHIHSKDFVAAH